VKPWVDTSDPGAGRGAPLNPRPGRAPHPRSPFVEEASEPSGHGFLTVHVRMKEGRAEVPPPRELASARVGPLLPTRVGPLARENDGYFRARHEMTLAPSHTLAARVTPRRE
jgi:hypothetical protein